MAVPKLRSLKLLLAGAITIGVFSLSSAGASSANISHSYQSSASISTGSIVSLVPSKTGYVESANTSNASQVLGVAVESDDSLLAVDAAEDKVQVATTGTASVLVSTVNGTVRVGDQVSVSPFNGVGVKATPGARVVGIAQSELADKAAGSQVQSVTDKSGETQSVTVGFVRLGIGLGTSSSTEANKDVNSLQKLGRSLTGRTISTVRIVVALVIALAALVALITLTYASIFSGIISVGRNPLAKHAVFRTVAAVLAIVAVMATVATASIFLILR